MINRRLTSSLRSAFVRNVMNDVPTVAYDELMQAKATEIARAALPNVIAHIWDHPDMRRYVVVWHCEGCAVPGVYVERVAEQIADELAPLEARKSAQRAHLKALTDKLRGVAAGCRTVGDLKRALPEFARYIPQDAAVVDRSVPVLANVVEEFVRAGWPKDKVAV